MENWKKNLHKGIKQGTNLLEIVSENIEKQIEVFSSDLDEKPSLIKKEIMKIVIEHLNNNLDSLCRKKK
jgi:predicted aspartyl protease